MDNKLERFLNTIDFNKDYYKYFENAKVKEVLLTKKTNRMTLILDIDKLLPIDIFKELYEKAHNLKGAESIRLKFIVKENNQYFEEYFNYYFDILVKNCPMLRSIDRDKITIENNNIKIEVLNNAEKEKIESLEEKIESFLVDMGFDDISIEANISEKLREEFALEIEKEEEKNEKTVKVDSLIKGRNIKGEASSIKNLITNENNVIIIGEVFGVESKTTQSGWNIITLKITDYTDSIISNIFTKDTDEFNNYLKRIKEGKWYKFRGNVKFNTRSNDYEFGINDIEEYSYEKKKIVDDAEVKRVELHAHTMMSQMDGITKLDLGKHTCELVEKCISMGYKGVAITDHSGCQAFPIAYQIISKYNKGKEEKDKFKGLYGTELTLVEDMITIVTKKDDRPFEGTEFVVFDTETTGFNAANGDQMIEIGAVKIKDGVITDRFDELINPGRHIPDKLTALTGITDEMVKEKLNEEEATKKFIEWIKDAPLVAHNAKFDISFIEMSFKKYNLGKFDNTVIDTLELSRALDQGFARHSLSALVKRYNVPFDEESHHRGDYDAEGTALVFYKMTKKLVNQNLEKISDLDKLISKEEIHKFGRTYHFNAIAINREGLKNLFKIISLANTTYLYKTPRILRSKLNELRSGLLIGSGCYESEVFREARSKDGEELTNIINFYDYVEVQPPEVYSHLIQTSDFANEMELENHIKKVINATKSAGKIIVATGDVHHFTREDKIYREIIVNQKVPGGGRHPLAKSEIKEIPSQHFRTTNEMLEDFSFLDKDLAYEIVVENTNKICDMVSEIEVIIDTKGVPFSPRVRSDDGKSYLDCPRVVTDLVFNKAKEWYGEVLPHNIEERISKELYGDAVYNYWYNKLKNENPDIEEKELVEETFKNLHETLITGFDKVKELMKEVVLSKWNAEEDGEQTEDAINKKVKKELGGIIGGGFDPIYLIAQRLVKHSNDDGYLVGSRGSVGSSFVATMMGITEVNPLPAHYRCENCKHSIFDDEDGNALGSTYSSGFDLPDKLCPKCNHKMRKDGQDMPFATFLGFNADKVPDIDLNFSDLNQASAHEYTKVLFGVDNVYRAGTIGTVADKTAYGFVKGYFEDRGIFDKRSCEIERLAKGCTGVKRTTGQHPGGIVVVPDYMDVSDFTPFQFPAEDPTSAWRTTHFDYHSIEEDLLKLDILGHSDPTQLRLIQDLSKTNVQDVPLDDKDTMSIFSSLDALGVTSEQIMCPTGTLGIPEFGTPFTIGMVQETKPTTFAELVKISGLSHGTDVWLGNAQELIKNNIVPFKEVIGCRDDIMVYLMYKGLKPIKAFKIMEFVRKGKASKDPETWKEHKQTMVDAGIEDWFIDSCEKIKYMFPKAHAAAYVTSAFRIAWYKVHMPVYFYASWFSTKATDFDIEAMINGYDAIKTRLTEIKEKGFDATNKESGVKECLNVALEASARGMKISNFDLYKSKSLTFDVLDDHTMIPPFITIDGLGETVAKNIEIEAKKKPFVSIEEFQTRCKVSQTLVDKMKLLGLFDNMPESSQLSLFDLGIE